MPETPLQNLKPNRLMSTREQNPWGKKLHQSHNMNAPNGHQERMAQQNDNTPPISNLTFGGNIMKSTNNIKTTLPMCNLSTNTTKQKLNPPHAHPHGTYANAATWPIYPPGENAKCKLHIYTHTHTRYSSSTLEHLSRNHLYHSKTNDIFENGLGNSMIRTHEKQIKFAPPLAPGWNTTLKIQPTVFTKNVPQTKLNVAATSCQQLMETEIQTRGLKVCVDELGHLRLGKRRMATCRMLTLRFATTLKIRWIVKLLNVSIWNNKTCTIAKTRVSRILTSLRCNANAAEQRWRSKTGSTGEKKQSVSPENLHQKPICSLHCGRCNLQAETPTPKPAKTHQHNHQ